METLGFIFGIFGLMAYLQISSLKGRIDSLERELTNIKGTSYHKERTDLIQAASSYIGKKVSLDLKEDHEDFEIINYGNSTYGSITVEDVDNDWMLVSIDSKKGTVRKLIRMESIEKIGAGK